MQGKLFGEEHGRIAEYEAELADLEDYLTSTRTEPPFKPRGLPLNSPNALGARLYYLQKEYGAAMELRKKLPEGYKDDRLGKIRKSIYAQNRRLWRLEKRLGITNHIPKPLRIMPAAS